MNRDRLALGTRIRRFPFLLGGLLGCSRRGHMSDGLSQGLCLLLLRDLSLLLLLLLQNVPDALAPWPRLVLDPEHGRPLGVLVDVVVAEVAA